MVLNTRTKRERVRGEGVKENVFPLKIVAPRSSRFFHYLFSAWTGPGLLEPWSLDPGQDSSHDSLD